MENQTPSAFQQQFPLSPKKFWKKMVGSFIGCFVFAIIFLAFAVIFGMSSQDASTTSLVWELFAAFIVFLIVYLFLRIWYVKVYIRRYFYSASDTFVTIKKGVFAPAEIHVQYQKVQDVYVDQDIIDRIMGIYDVHIASATVASSIEAHIDGVEEIAADGLKNFFLGKISGGGPLSPAQATVESTSQAARGTMKPLDVSQMISSEQYPIQSQWIMSRAVSAFFIALIWAAWATLYTAFYFPVGLIVFIFVFLGILIYNNTWKGNYHFAFLPDYIQLNTKVIGKSEEHMPYRSIQDVIVKQGIVERMFGLATVYIQNAAAQPMQRGRKRGGIQAIKIPGQTPENANKIAEIIRSISLTKNTTRTGL